jgi:hypothetical protein
LSDNLSVLSDTQKVVVQTITMRLHTEDALSYLKDCGIKMARRNYFRYKKVESLKWQRLMNIANLFTDQHLQRMDKLELVEELMRKNYHEEKSPIKKVTILQAVVMMRPYLSAYYNATRYVLSKRLKTDQIAKPEIGYLELKKFNKEEFDDEERKKIRDMTDMTPLS